MTPVIGILAGSAVLASAALGIANNIKIRKEREEVEKLKQELIEFRVNIAFSTGANPEMINKLEEEMNHGIQETDRS